MITIDTENTASTGTMGDDQPIPDDQPQLEGSDVDVEDQGRDTSGDDGTKLDEFGYPQPPP